MPTGFLAQVNSIDSKLEPVAREALAAGAEVVVKALRERLQEVIFDGDRNYNKSTGELVAALGVSQMRLDRNGNYDVKVGFMEPRSDGEVNAKIANIMEYGTSKRPARPFLAPTKAKKGRACKEAIRRVFEERFGK
jgi:HK97 gp10 family phage protein